MSLYSISFFSTFDEVVGYPSGYRPQGYLFAATNERHLKYLRENYQRRVRELSVPGAELGFQQQRLRQKRPGRRRRPQRDRQYHGDRDLDPDWQYHGGWHPQRDRQYHGDRDLD